MNSNKLYTRIEGDMYHRKVKEGDLSNNNGIILNNWGSPHWYYDWSKAVTPITLAGHPLKMAGHPRKGCQFQVGEKPCKIHLNKNGIQYTSLFY